MPELPEVETIRRGLQRHLLGALLDDVELLDPRLTQPLDPAGLATDLRGRRVTALDRRGKYLLLLLDDDLVAIHHLRMTGSFSVVEGEGHPEAKYVRARYHVRRTDGSHCIVQYHDPRRFGTLDVLGSDDAREYLDARLGPEPLGDDFDGAYLHTMLQARTAPVKAVLLDQKVVAGIGNIYADEALFQARIAPGTAAVDVSPRAAARLAEAVADRLEVAISSGGSTLRDYRSVEGQAGTMQERFLVYGRAGEPCVRCGRALRAAKVAGRGTVWCGHCQPPPRTRLSRR